MLNEIMNDAVNNEVMPTNAAMEEVSKLCKDLHSTENEIENLENKLKEAKKRLEFISTEQLPELLRQYGFSELKLTDGSKISVTKQYFASITEEKRSDAYEWLRENECGHIIKDKFEINFSKRKKGESNEDYDRIINILVENRIPFNEKGEIPWQTLRAFVKEQCEDPEKAETFPKELFGTFVKDVAKIKKG